MTNFNFILNEIINLLNELENYFPEGTDNDFIQILVPVFRRTMHNARSISILVNYNFSNPDFGEIFNDSAMSLIRKSLEDFISVKYMITFDKDTLIKKFLEHADGEFVENSKLINQYSENKLLTAEDINKITKAQSRSWCGKSFETQLDELSSNGKIDERDKSLFYITYHLSSRTLHTSGSDIKRFSTLETTNLLSNLHKNTSLIFINIVILELAAILLQEYKTDNLWQADKIAELSERVNEFKRKIHQ
jgi:hypothetical protein